jgi:hypothetical protein
MLDHNDRKEIRNYINMLLINGISDDGTTEDQAFNSQQTAGDTQKKRPVVHPFGFVSRAPSGKNCVLGQFGENIGARVVLGFRDANRAKKDYLEVGECEIYSEPATPFENSEKVVLKKDKVLLGSENAENPLVLGDILMNLFTELFDLFGQMGQGLTTSPGNPTAPNPTFVAKIEVMRQKYIALAATNIVSQHVYTERSK